MLIILIYVIYYIRNLGPCLHPNLASYTANTTFPTLHPSAVAALAAPFTVLEITHAIKALLAGKSSGPG